MSNDASRPEGSHGEGRAVAASLRGACFVITAASGTGKSTLLRHVFSEHPESTETLAFSVSHNTRPPRPGEVDGRDYHFVGEAAFRRMVDDDAFLEWAEVHGQLKGTSLQEVERLRGAGHDVVLEIDVQGAEQIRRRVDGAVSIFVLPPSYAELERRLRQRGLDDEDQIERRLADARQELGRAGEFDYVIVNDDLAAASRALAAIFLANRFRRDRMRPHIESVQASRPPS